MTKHLISLAISIAFAACGFGQTLPPRNSSTVPNTGNTGQFAAGGIQFSNRLGQTYSAENLATQLRNLRSAVDQTLPMLTAFNESYSNSTTRSQSPVGSAISGIVSDVFNRNQNAGQNGNQSSRFLSTSNLLSVLHGLVNTNSSGTITAPPANAQDLLALQNDLQPVLAILERLNVSPTAGQTTPAPNTAVPQQYPNGNLSPTGR